MSRTPLHPTLLLLALALTVSAPAARGDVAAVSPAEQAARAQRVIEIKRLQQKLLLSEALEAARERAERSGKSEPAERSGKSEPAERSGKSEPAERRGNSEPAERHSKESAARRRYHDLESGRRGTSQRPAPPERPEPPAPAGALHRSAAPLSALGINSMVRNVPVNDPNVDTAARADGQSEPSIAALGNNVLAAWNDGRGLAISGLPNPTLPNVMNYGWSTDGGQNFQTAPPTGPRAMPQIPAGGLWSSDPIVMVNETNGDFWLCGLYEPNDWTGQDRSLNGVAVVRGNFNVDGLVDWQVPIVAHYEEDDVTGFVDKPWLAVDPANGNLYLTFTLYQGAGNAIMFQRSTDRGQTWSTPVQLSSNAASGLVQGSRPVVGPGGEVYATWKEIGYTTAEDYIRIRKSTNAGTTWGAERTVASLYDNFGTGAPGFNREQGITLPSIAVDRSSGPHRGRVYVAWNESVDFYDSVPDTHHVQMPEVEPNDDVGQAQSFTPGDAIRGTFKSTTDYDYFRFDATAGASYVFYTIDAQTRYTMRILGREGYTRLAFSGDRFNTPPNAGFIVWTCPVSGSYYLRLAIYGAGIGTPYKVFTKVDAPGGGTQRARDERDAFVAYSDDGTTWATPVMLTSPEPGAYDDWLPEVAVTAQGAVYAAWYDFSQGPEPKDGGWSQMSIARSDDGGASWNSLGPISDAFNGWTNVNSNVIPNQGDYLSLFANGNQVIPCWSDGRIGTPDIWAAPFAIAQLQVEIESVATDSDHVAIQWRANNATPYPSPIVVLRAPGIDSTFNYVPIDTLDFDPSTGVLAVDDSSIAGHTRWRYALRLPTGRVIAERTVSVQTAEVVIPPPPPAWSPWDPFPNPARPTLLVRFRLPDEQPGDLRLVDLTGRPIKYQRYQGAGSYEVYFGNDLTIRPGLYFLRLTHGGHDYVQRVAIY